MTDFTKEQIKQALIQNNGWNGGGVWNTSVNLTYSFGGTKMPYWNGIDYKFHGVDENTFKPLSSGQQTAFINAVALWESVANIHLTPGTPYSVTTGSTTLSFGDIVVVGGKLKAVDLDASTISPTSTRSADSAGDIVIGNTGIADTHNNLLAPGQTGFNTFVHELGHALGLNHPINYPGESSVTNPLPFDPGQRYTIMSYQPVKGMPGFTEWWASKPMLYDILAIQILYGVNPTTNAEDGSSYTFKTGADAIQAIWDAGGIDDVIDAHEQIEGVTLDLRPGHFSFVGKNESTSQQQIAIAYQVTGQENNWIENAIGGSGNDELIGNDGDNELTGGEGNDILQGGDGADTYIFTGNYGTDVITDSDGLGSMTIDGQDLNSASQKAENIYQNDSSGYTVVKVNAGNTLIIAKAGGANRIIINDWSEAQNLGISLQNDTSTPPAVTLAGDFKKKIDDHGTADTGDDTYVMTNGNYTADENAADGEAGALDLITGTEGNDVIDGKGGSDALSGKAGDDDIEGGTEGDIIQGGLGKDSLKGGAGDDLIYGASDVNITKPTRVNFIHPVNDYSHPQATGFNWISGYDTTLENGVPYSFSDAPRNRLADDQGNIIDGGAGNDFIAAGTGVDYVHGGADKDEIWGMDKDDILFGDSGNDFVCGDGDKQSSNSLLWTLPENHGNDIIDGGEGDDILYGQGGNDIIYGGADNDKIWGDDIEANLALANHGDDYLYGGAGNDFLTGGGGNDLFEGGIGDDTLDGGVGNDTYIFNKGDGHDTVIDPDKDNTFIFGEGISQDDITLRLGSLLLDLGNGDEIHINGFEQTDVFNSASVGTFTFADGSALSLNQLLARGFDLNGTSQNDTIAGTNTTDRIKGLEGSDILAGFGGNDLLEGGAGNDELQGGEGDDRLDGGADDDVLFGQAGDDLLLGGVGIDRLQGGADNDTLDGGADNDILFGESGDDSLLGNDGNDELQGNEGNDYLDGGAGDDRLFGQDGNDSLNDLQGNNILLGGLGLDVLISGAGNDSLYGDEGDDSLVAGDGADILLGGIGLDTLLGGLGMDTLQGGEGDDVLDGGAENDQLFGQGGNDNLQGGSGLDRLQSGTGNDTLDGGADDDLLFGEAGADNLFGGIGADRLHGNEDNDFLDGGEDNDVLFGEASNDTLLGGDGSDQLQGNEGDDNLNGGTGDDWLYGQSGNDLLSDDEGNNMLAGGDGSDTLNSGAGDDELYGDAGNDSLNGGDGWDILSGGSGSDVLQGGAGGDTYRINAGDGIDRVNDFFEQGYSGIRFDNVMVFGQGIYANNLSLGIGSLLIKLNNNGDAVHIEGFDPDHPYANPVISRFEFADGTVLSYEQLLSRGFDLAGTPDADVIHGTGANDRIDALASDDVVYGQDGNDTLDGGSGADTLLGGTGNDVYHVDADGDVVIEDNYAGQDSVLSRVSYTLPEAIEVLSLADGMALDGTGNGLNNDLSGNNSDNRLVGLDGNDTLIGHAGNDTLDGGSGGDVLAGGDGYDYYVVDDSSDTLTEEADAGQDRVDSSVSFSLSANLEDLNLLGDAALSGSGNELNNNLTGNTGDNQLYGLEGNDFLIGNAGNDVLDGGSGIDILFGGSGDDNYSVNDFGDLVLENTDDGIDTVYSGVSYLLRANLENLALVDGPRIDGYGNELANRITGNDQANRLDGLGGAEPDRRLRRRLLQGG